MIQKRKDPAATGIAPDRGSNNSLEENEMNVHSNSTYAGAVPAGTQIEHAWERARILSLALSRTLAECDEGRWHAWTLSAGNPYAVGYGATPEPETPMDRVQRHARALSDAMNDYRDGKFHAMIWPSAQAGHTVFFQRTPMLKGAAE